MSLFSLEFQVRDSELDMQGIVNNGNYFRYFEHARHQYLRSLGLSFAQLTLDKQLLVLISSYIEYKNPLRSGDTFLVTCKLVPESRIKFAFEQEIMRLPDRVLIATSRNVAVCLDGNHGNKPYMPEFVRKKLSTSSP